MLRCSIILPEVSEQGVYHAVIKKENHFSCLRASTDGLQDQVSSTSLDPSDIAIAGEPINLSKSEKHPPILSWDIPNDNDMSTAFSVEIVRCARLNQGCWGSTATGSVQWGWNRRT